MKTLDHKLVCWGDYAIPVRLNENWLTFNKNGVPWTSKYRPYSMRGGTCWEAPGGQTRLAQHNLLTITPPEPGPWHTQVYWIG